MNRHEQAQEEAARTAGQYDSAAKAYLPTPATGRDMCAAKETDMRLFASGAKSSVEKPRYDLVPAVAVELIAERFAYGAARHGARNYRKGANDTDFVRDRTNHLIEHVMKYAETGSRADLAAVGCNFAILADIGAFEGSTQRERQQTVEKVREELFRVEREYTALQKQLHYMLEEASRE